MERMATTDRRETEPGIEIKPVYTAADGRAGRVAGIPTRLTRPRVQVSITIVLIESR